VPKTITSDELDAIVLVVAKHPSGVGMIDLAEALSSEASARTLQRRVASLVRAKRLEALGAGRSTKYRLPILVARMEAVDGVDNFSAAIEVYVPISPEGESIRQYIRQPIQQRRPVSYDIAFLEAYEPNHTHYLPSSLRLQLHGLGHADVDPGAAAGTFARDILQRLLIDLSWASSRLEGNTYSRLDTERLIEHGRVAEGKDAVETQMILNHKAAIDYLVHAPSVAVDAHTVIALHALLSDGLMRDAAASGRIRRRVVEVSGSVYHPLGLPQRLEELFEIVLRMAAEIDDPFEQSFFLMVHLPYLQPFEDVNKRTSRLAANIPLARHNLAPLSFVDVPPQAYIDGLLGVYETKRVDLLRDVFVWAYERSCQQYTAVKQQLVVPDTFRLLHRPQLAAAIQTIIRNGSGLDDRALKRAIPVAVDRKDRERFTALLRSEFETLHAGNAVRFGLQLLEFEAWQQEQSAAPAPPRKTTRRRVNRKGS
jgi:Fic/DOC family